MLHSALSSVSLFVNIYVFIYLFITENDKGSSDHQRGSTPVQPIYCS